MIMTLPTEVQRFGVSNRFVYATFMQSRIGVDNK